MDGIDKYLKGSNMDAFICSLTATPISIWVALNIESTDYFIRITMGVIVWVAFFCMFLNKIKMEKVLQYLRDKENGAESNKD